MIKEIERAVEACTYVSCEDTCPLYVADDDGLTQTERTLRADACDKLAAFVAAMSTLLASRQ